MGIEEVMLRMKEEEQRYAMLTGRHFDELNDDELIRAILANIRYRIAGENEDSHKIVVELSRGIQMVYTLFWLDAEVRNGGFRQYIYNPSGILWPSPRMVDDPQRTSG